MLHRREDWSADQDARTRRSVQKRPASSMSFRWTNHKTREDHVEPGSVWRGAHRTDEEPPGISQTSQTKEVVPLAIDGVPHLEIRPGAADPEPYGWRVIQ